MITNPYKYKGPLNPITDQLVTVPREKEVNKIRNGITRNDYLAILGPRQIGKTTLLKILQHRFKEFRFLYFDFETPPDNQRDLYEIIKEEFCKKIPVKKKNIFKQKSRYTPALDFLRFLNDIKPLEKGKIVLLFDEIDSLPAVGEFLHLWRKVHIDRFDHNNLYRYNVIVTGSKDLISLTLGPNSPFNVAELLYMEDFSIEESRHLVTVPFSKLEITIEESAKEELLSQTSGHPQLLQHICHYLVETALLENRAINRQDIKDSIEILFLYNSNLITLSHDLKGDNALLSLSSEIMDGAEKKFHNYKQHSLNGAGVIGMGKSHCIIRNKIYESVIRDILQNPNSFPYEENFNRQIINKLTQSQQKEIDYFSNLLDQEKINSNALEEILSLLVSILNRARENRMPMPIGLTSKAITYVSDTISDKRREIKHRLKLSIPIIPLILCWEGEIEDSVKKLKKIWNKLSRKKED